MVGCVGISLAKIKEEREWREEEGEGKRNRKGEEERKRQDRKSKPFPGKVKEGPPRGPSQGRA